MISLFFRLSLVSRIARFFRLSWFSLVFGLSRFFQLFPISQVISENQAVLSFPDARILHILFGCPSEPSYP